jgi:hypothetical protein
MKIKKSNMSYFAPSLKRVFACCLPLGPAVNDFHGNPSKAAQIHFNE